MNKILLSLPIFLNRNMAKKNRGKVVRMLSPENYIRQKARTLPVYECIVNSDWEDSRLVQLSIARQHTNGNITVVFYLVDLLCLGIKDTHFMFNVSKSEYREQFEKHDGQMSFQPINYELAHNIVYAGLEFAEDYGIKPHKDFTSTTRFMLEEDTEDIDLIDIECGRNGVPVYMRGFFDDDATVQRTLAQLERTAGPGNYIFLNDDEDLDEFDDDEYDNDEFDDEEYDDDEFGRMSFDEKREKFLGLCTHIDELDKDNSVILMKLANSLVDELIDVDLHNKYYDEFYEKLNVNISEDPLEDYVLGITPGERIIFDEMKKRFLHIYQLIPNDPDQAGAELKKFEKDSQGLPGTYFLELLLLQKQGSRNFSKRLKEYALKYPAYPLIRLIYETGQVIEGKEPSEILDYPFSFETFFPGRKTISEIEQVYFLTFHLFLATRGDDLNKTEAFDSVLGEFDLSEKDYEILASLNMIIKINQLVNFLTR